MREIDEKERERLRDRDRETEKKHKSWILLYVLTYNLLFNPTAYHGYSYMFVGKTEIIYSMTVQ